MPSKYPKQTSVPPQSKILSAAPPSPRLPIHCSVPYAQIMARSVVPGHISLPAPIHARAVAEYDNQVALAGAVTSRHTAITRQVTDLQCSR